MSTSIRSTTIHFDKKKVPRFHSLGNEHVSAIESLYKQFPFLNDRMEIHMPYNKARSTFSNGTIWLWPKFDKRPVGFLIFMDRFAPCIWYPERQEGMTFRWLLPPNFCQHGPTICLANILAGESVLQIEDIIIHNGIDIWSTKRFSERWNVLRDFWNKLPSEQPLLAFKPQVVKPITLDDWHSHYDSSIYWIIQPDTYRSPRWFWKDTVTVHQKYDFTPPTLKRSTEIVSTLCALCVPYTKMNLPDIYTILSQENETIGIPAISKLSLSHELREYIAKYPDGFPVEVKWNNGFSKYEICKILPMNTPITTSSFFYHKDRV
jgi:hypothetical protein